METFGYHLITGFAAPKGETDCAVALGLVCEDEILTLLHVALSLSALECLVPKIYGNRMPNSKALFCSCAFNRPVQFRQTTPNSDTVM